MTSSFTLTQYEPELLTIEPSFYPKDKLEVFSKDFSRIFFLAFFVISLSFCLHSPTYVICSWHFWKCTITLSIEEECCKILRRERTELCILPLMIDWSSRSFPILVLSMTIMNRYFILIRSLSLPKRPQIRRIQNSLFLKLPSTLLIFFLLSLITIHC